MEPRRRISLVVLLVLLLLAVFLLVQKCKHEEPAPKTSSPTSSEATAPTVAQPPSEEPEEVLTSANLLAPEQVTAGAMVQVDWSGPENRGDFITIVSKDAPDERFGVFRETREGRSLQLTAPIDPGAYELRYVSGRSHTVLGRAALTVVPAGATLEAAAEVVLGSELTVEWTGPDNHGDYVTLVPQGTPDGEYGNHALTTQGHPLTVTAPAEAGEAELRYVTGQGARILARRPVRIVEPSVSLEAAAEAVAGTKVAVTWIGPDNHGDYITLVPVGTPDGQYANYTVTSEGNPLQVRAPIEPGAAELRYMTGQGAHVLARRAITIRAASVTLDAPAQAVAGSRIEVAWSGPGNDGDYVTVVAVGTPDGQYGNYTNAAEGTPLQLLMPIEPGAAELRYMTGQGARVLARRAIEIVAAVITLSAPDEVPAGSAVEVVWTGPDNPGDYITLVAPDAAEGQYASYASTNGGSPSHLTALKDPGAAELRYVSGQGARTLARRPIRIVP